LVDDSLCSSLPAYLEWIDGEADSARVWAVISRTLGRYASAVDARGGKEYDPVYPVVLELGKSLLGAAEQ
jgi:hypothetical protein